VSNSNHRAQTPVILGRPFLATANAIINCRNGSMRLTFGDMTRKVNVFNLGKQPRDLEDQTFEVNLIENLTREHREELKLETECDFGLEFDDFNLDQVVNFDVNWASNPISPIMEPTNLTSPSNQPSSSFELKVFPAHLKYVYLGEQETFPVIIVSHLNDWEEEDLKAILRKHRKAIGWTMTNIKGLSPTIIKHCIHLNENATLKETRNVD